MSDSLHALCTPFPPDTPVPLRPFAHEWRTEAVLGLAFGIRADEAFDRMPILADALEEAGCDDLLLLNHCRYCERHTPGCWAVECVFPSDHDLWMDAVALAAGREVPAEPDDQPHDFNPVNRAEVAVQLYGGLIVGGVVLLVAFGLFQVFRTLVFGPPPVPSTSAVTGTAPASPSRGPPSPPR